VAKPRDQLAIRGWTRRAAAYDPRPASAPVQVADATGQSLVHDAWSLDEQIVVGVRTSGDELHEALEMLEPVRLARGLGSPATMADARVISNVARGTAVRRHIRQESLDCHRIARPVDDHRLAGVDPDQGARVRHVTPPAIRLL
jgi:hypothetical protein